MHVIIKGKAKDQKAKTIKWFIIAKNGDGPQIPTIPATILAKKISQTKSWKEAPCLAWRW